MQSEGRWRAGPCAIPTTGAALMPRHPDPDERALNLLAGSAGAVGPAGDCPSPDLVGGWAERKLTPGEMEIIERHLAACDSCRALARALAFEVRMQLEPA